MAKEVESMDRMIRLQLKLTPRRANLAMRTRVLIFYWESVSMIRESRHLEWTTYDILCLLLLRSGLAFLEDLLFPKGRAQRVDELLAGSTGSLQGTLQWRPR
jgi:hypothetical protein